MSWNYRVVHSQEYSTAAEDVEDVYRVVEMFYEGDNDDKPNGWGDASAQASTLVNVRHELVRMLLGCEKPVIKVCGECHNIAPGHKPDCNKFVHEGLHGAFTNADLRNAGQDWGDGPENSGGGRDRDDQ